MTFRCFQLFLAASVACSSAIAQEALVDHQHARILVRSRPVIERLPLRVIHPVDVVVRENRDTLVADQVGKVVFWIDSERETSVLGEELDGLVRIADSKIFGVHALTSTKNSGRIIRLLENGFQEEVCELSFRPGGLATDSVGNLWTLNPIAGEVVLLGSDGEQKKTIPLNGFPRDIDADELGAAVLLKSGRIVSVGHDGSTEFHGYVPSTATRLRFMADGSLVALVTDAEGKSILVRPTDDRNDPVDRFAATPRGTSAFAFDKLGNVTLANPDLRAITRVTSHFTVPCPHCGKPVEMLFSPTAPAMKPVTRRNF